MDFRESETVKNLMRAFAGESQARNRYTMAASQAKANGLYVVETVFTFTADQEKEHAKLFYRHLKDMAGETIAIDGGYPVDIDPEMAKLLRMAQHNELEEYGDVYKNFGDTAKQEGFEVIGDLFHNIAEIEKTHADRFEHFARLLEMDSFLCPSRKRDGCVSTAAIFIMEKKRRRCVRSASILRATLSVRSWRPLIFRR